MSEYSNKKTDYINDKMNDDYSLGESQKDELVEIIALLKDIKSESEQQNKMVKRRLILSYITCSISLLILIICVLVVVPRVVSVCNQASDIIAKSSTLIDETSTIADNLKTISEDLSKLELENTLYNMDNLVDSSEKTVTAAMNKIESIDIDTLNKSINDLSAIISPLAKLFGN